jgi:plastocyanin
VSTNAENDTHSEKVKSKNGNKSASDVEHYNYGGLIVYYDESDQEVFFLNYDTIHSVTAYNSGTDAYLGDSEDTLFIKNTSNQTNHHTFTEGIYAIGTVTHTEAINIGLLVSDGSEGYNLDVDVLPSIKCGCFPSGSTNFPNNCTAGGNGSTSCSVSTSGGGGCSVSCGSSSDSCCTEDSDFTYD